MFECLDIDKLDKDRVAVDLLRKKADIIIGFTEKIGGNTFLEGDIAMETDMITVL